MDKISAAVEACLGDEDVKQQLANIGVEPEFLNAESYGKKLSDTSTAAEKLMKDIGLI